MLCVWDRNGSKSRQERDIKHKLNIETCDYDDYRWGIKMKYL
jgi:hypothetical protein